MTYAQDMQAQTRWLRKICKRHGLSMDQLVIRHQASFFRLARIWRARNGVPLS